MKQGIATNNEQISNTPSSQNDATLTHTGMNAPNYVDQRREIPRQGFTNISAQHQNNYVNNLVRNLLADFINILSSE